MKAEIVIDGYAHSGLKKFLPIPDLLAAMEAASVSRAVLVQYLGEYDNSYLAQAMVEHPGRFAGVGLVDPFSDDWPARLAEVVSAGFRGLRFPMEWLPTKMEVALAACAAGLNIVVYVPKDMAAAVPVLRQLARGAGDRKIVVSHLGAPRVSGTELAEGLELLELAEELNVLTTLSGFSMYSAHPHEELGVLVTRAIELFGPSRVMWGSNFPVVLDRESYGDDLALVREGRWGLGGAAIAEVLCGTASRLWFDAG